MSLILSRTCTALSEPLCPVCAQPGAKPLWRVTAPEAAQHWVLREADPAGHEALAQIITELWQTDDCQVVECAACSFGFAWPYVAGDAQFYNLAFPRASYPRHRWEYDRTLAALRGVAGERWVLEIGAGTGEFLGMLPSTVTNANKVLAAEYSAEARRTLAARGYSTCDHDIRDDYFLRYEGRFGLVFMFQVLEHMDRLDALFERLRLITSPDARIFISVPNSRRVRWHEQHGGLLDMPPGHIGRWRIKAFFALARRFGLVVADTDQMPVEGPGRFIVDDLVSAFQRRAQRPGSVANRVRRLPRSAFRRVLEVATLALYAPSRLPHLATAARKDFGGTLWAELQRAAPTG